MKPVSVYQYKSYKSFLLDWIDRTPQGGRGQRKLLAEAVGCQTPFITHVLSGDYHFSPEQAEACSRWLGLNELEGEFFLWLVMKDRAGTSSLRTLFERQLETARDRENNLNAKVKIQKTLAFADQMTYYSHWLYSAVHMAVLNPQLRTIDKLQKYFQVPTAQLMNALDFLTTHGLLEATSSGFKNTQPMLFLPRESPLLPLHHANWRMKAIEKSHLNDKRNLHYSLVMSLSNEAYSWIRQRLVDVIEESAEQIKPSPDEKLGCFLMDLFEV